MAVFVLGAGATRALASVKGNEERPACLPPLNADFFTQLQRIEYENEQNLISDVVRDVVLYFGPNFDVNLETVFSTYEHQLKLTANVKKTTTSSPNLSRRRVKRSCSPPFWRAYEHRW